MAPISSSHRNPENKEGETEPIDVGYVIGPLAGTDIQEYANREHPSDTDGFNTHLILRYMIYGLNVFMLLVIVVTSSIILYSFFSLKRFSAKKVANVQDSQKDGVRTNQKSEECVKLEKEFKKLKKRFSDRENNLAVKKNSKGRKRDVARHVVKMDERKLAEVLHALAQLPEEKEGYLVDDDVEDDGVVVLGVDESICVVDERSGR
uniref:BZIP domain-containing protein n=1 Tax=Strongyloides papillosus TaxID=174720 RepID=A0A0N5C1P6_STREA